jgi:enoyl-CoA hydratase
MPTQPVCYDLSGGVGIIRIDDGKVNAMSVALLGALNAALDRAQADNAAVLMVGRPGIFSAGFDMKQLMSDPATIVALLRAGAELCVRMLDFPRPIVTASTGHAYPMGAFLMLSADYRFGVDGPFRIGMNEVAIGLAPPQFAIELARARLLPAFFNRTAITGELFSPTTAMAAGFLDEVVESDVLFDRALAKANVFAALNPNAHLTTKRRARASLIDAMRTSIESDITLENISAALG